MHLGHSISRRSRVQEGHVDSLRPTVNRFAKAAALAGLAIAVAGGTVHAYSTVRIASGLNRPVYAKGITYAGVGDIVYIVEQLGYVRLIVNGAQQATPFLDIDALVPNISGNDERGFLGFALDPDFVENGIFYVHYSNLSGNTTVARYHTQGGGNAPGDPLDADETSAEIILSVTQPFSNHNGGFLEFGPDGYMYLGLGDGGSGGDPGNRAQNGNTLLGKMLRIDPRGQATYVIPPDNPFAAEGDGFLNEIWDYGLRNPWRCSFDRVTGDLWIGDVGQNAWEEIDFEPADSPGGVNYGWRLMEGTHCFNPPTDCDNGMLQYPIWDYAHPGGAARSVTGGYVYRGPSIPELDGAYFFADFVTSEIWSLTHDGSGGNVVVTDRTASLAPGGGLSINSIASFGEGSSGELYIVDRGGATTGEVYQLVQDPSDVPDQGVILPGLGIQLRSDNPFSSSNPLAFAVTLENETDVVVDVINMTGQRVRELDRMTIPAGEQVFVWDGRDDSGNMLPAGVYALRARSTVQQVSQKVQMF